MNDIKEKSSELCLMSHVHSVDVTRVQNVTYVRIIYKIKI